MSPNEKQKFFYCDFCSATSERPQEDSTDVSLQDGTQAVACAECVQYLIPPADLEDARERVRKGKVSKEIRETLADGQHWSKGS